MGCSHLLCDYLKVSSDITRSCRFCNFSKESETERLLGSGEGGAGGRKRGKVIGSSKEGRGRRLLCCNDQAMLQRLSDFLCIAFCVFAWQRLLYSSDNFSYCSY